MTSTEQVPCAKCGGSGKYYYRDGAVEQCYSCGGSGKVTRRPQTQHPCSLSYTERLRLNWETRLRNAEKGLLSYADMIDPEYMGYTAQRVYDDVHVIGLAKHFRALGWPV